MDYQKLANLLYPNINLTIADYEEKYPKRDLKEGAEVCRFAPSPTGRMHMGNLYASFIPEVFAHQSGGVFILRIEDTDEKRSIEDGIKFILEDLKSYNYIIDENPIEGGNYGPYIQTQRTKIYHTFAKHLVTIGRAYPCFCDEKDLNSMREKQEKHKFRVGYYGHYAKCRDLSYEEIKEKIEEGKKFVLRLKSNGDFNKKISFKDLIKGRIEMPQNDIDHVLVKSDGIPPYAFAHVVDDYLMRVTIITRDDSYISSMPYHLEIWQAFGFKSPKYAHILPLNIKEGNIIRKISKRKDPEAAVSFHHEKGIPTEAVKIYFATLLNSNFEGWLSQNINKTYRDFKFEFNKMSTSGSLFDNEKLENISKNYLSSLSAIEIYEMLIDWSFDFDHEFYDILCKYKDYSLAVLNIEREQKKPRKDFAFLSEIKANTWYMFDEYFNDSQLDLKKINIVNNVDKIKDIINQYISVYFDYNDNKEEWFNKIKQLSDKNNYASNMKLYKENPNSYNGSVADISNYIRIALTNKTTTPDLYEIIKLLGSTKVIERLSSFIEKN